MMGNTLIELAPVHYTANAISVLQFNVPPKSQCFRLHWHDRIELLRVTRGKLFVVCGTELKQVSSGEMIILPPKALHKGYAIDEMVEYTMLAFDVRSFYNETEICKTLLPAIFDGRAIFKAVTSDRETISCFDNICRQSSKDLLEINSMIYQLIYLFFKNNLLEFTTQPNNIAVKEVLDYLEENFRQEINITSLCKKFGYSPAYFCRKFKQTTGLTPMSYLKIYRLEQARKKIRNQSSTISEIASECGFADPNYFTRCFKEHFGKPPTYFKNNRI